MGRIDIPSSLQTMERGEIWRINPTLVKMQTVRNCCSMASKGDKVFSASCPGYTDPCITITRLK